MTHAADLIIRLAEKSRGEQSPGEGNSSAEGPGGTGGGGRAGALDGGSREGGPACAGETAGVADEERESIKRATLPSPRGLTSAALPALLSFFSRAARLYRGPAVGTAGGSCQ